MIRVASPAVCLVLAISTGCYSGGSSKHVPPDAVYYDEETVLTFEVVVIGDVGKGVDKRYTDEKAFFRMKGEKAYRLAKTSREVLSDTTMHILVTIPPIDERSGDVLEYYCEVTFDGHLNFLGRSDNPKRVKMQRRRH
jgi:hypothetical protein